MLLLVGLVAIVFVIVVVVFLSVRSMRADEGHDYPARTSRPGRRGSRRGEKAGAGRRADARGGQAGRQPARHGPADDDWPDGREPEFGEPEYGPARAVDRRGEDRGRGARAGDRPGIRHRMRQESGARLTGSGQDGPGARWPAGDWGGVSDEQYWAELSADKPLATTARSAHPGAGQGPAAAGPGEDEPAAGPGGPPARRNPAAARSQPEPDPDPAAIGAPAAQFSLRARPGPAASRLSAPAEPPAATEPHAFAELAAAEPATPAEPWAGPAGTGGVDTDPGIGAGGWRDMGAPRDDAAAWPAPDRGAPGTRDTRAWAEEDPLTSPSFAVPSAYSADSRSYRGSHHRDLGRPGEPADVSGGASYGRGRSYPAAPAWEGTSPPAAASPYGDARGRHADRWRDSGHEYSGGALEPLPEPGGRKAEPAGHWYSAPASPADWQAAEPDRLEGARYDRAADHGAGYGSGSAPPGYDDHAGYEPPGYDPAGTGYEPPGRHGRPGHGWPRHGRGEPGYQPSRYGLPDTGDELPGFGRRPAHGHYPGLNGGPR